MTLGGTLWRTRPANRASDADERPDRDRQRGAAEHVGEEVRAQVDAGHADHRDEDHGDRDARRSGTAQPTPARTSTVAHAISATA